MKRTRDRAGLDLAMNQLAKQFGKGTVTTMSEVMNQDQVAPIPTGCFQLNRALGGGYPVGRFIEMFGPTNAGKTTMALQAIAACQQQGGQCLFIDAEHKLDWKYAEALGVDPDKLHLHQPNTAEEALEVMETMIRSNAVDFIVLDSIAGLCTRAELEGDMGDTHVSAFPTLLSQAFRKLAATTRQSQTTVLLLNQMRTKVGVMFGSPETTPGGNALRFAVSVRLDLRRVGSIKEKSNTIGQILRIKIVKSVVSPTFEQFETSLIYHEGIDRAGELLDLAIAQEIMTTKGGWFRKNGAWYSYNDERIGQGRNVARTWLNEHPDVMDELEAALLAT